MADEAKKEGGVEAAGAPGTEASGVEAAEVAASPEKLETKAAAPEAAEAAPDLEAELARARAQAAEYLDQWRRAVAELSNARKRMEREREEMTRLSNQLLLTRLLPVLDDLERAMAALPPDMLRFSWVEGVAYIQRKLWLTLEGEGLKRIQAAGQPFDPQRHEAVLREETTTCPDGQVMAELQTGYELHGRVLRPALVKVAVAPQGGAEAGDQPPPPPTAEA